MQKFLLNRQLLKYLNWNSLGRDFMFMLIFGLLSFILAKINFNIAGLEYNTTDLREIPLLVSLFHINNPFFVLLISVFQAFERPEGAFFGHAYITHSASLLLLWGLYYWLKRVQIRSLFAGIIWLFYTFIYYLLFLFPISILSRIINGQYLLENAIDIYLEMLKSISFELVTAAIITAVYLVQHRMRVTLLLQEANLERTVKERTEELEIMVKELKNTQKQLIQTEKMATLGTLVAGVAHEINNPLNFIHGGVSYLDSYLNERLPENAAELKPVMDGINTGVKRVHDIVKSLSFYSRSTEIENRTCDIHKIIDDCLLILHSQYSTRIEIKKEFADEPKNVLGNEGKLHQAFLNVIANSVQAISEHGVIGVRTLFDDAWAVITITDSGEGVAKENIGKVFDPFFTTRPPDKGTGLGLSIAYNIIQEHLGGIDFESEKGVGTSVQIRIPIK